MGPPAAKIGLDSPTIDHRARDHAGRDGRQVLKKEKDAGNSTRAPKDILISRRILALKAQWMKEGRGWPQVKKRSTASAKLASRPASWRPDPPEKISAASIPGRRNSQASENHEPRTANTLLPEEVTEGRTSPKSSPTGPAFRFHVWEGERSARRWRSASVPASSARGCHHRHRQQCVRRAVQAFRMNRPSALPLPRPHWRRQVVLQTLAEFLFDDENAAAIEHERYMEARRQPASSAPRMRRL